MTMAVHREAISTVDPFDLAAIDRHCRTSGVAEFLPELQSQARAAATELEQYSQIALLDQKITVTLDRWPRASWFSLPVGPMPDALSVAITVDGEPYEGFAVIAGPRPALRFTGAKPCGLVVIEYEAGFGALAADIPEDIALALMDQVAATFDARGLGDGKTNGMSPHMARIAARYRRVAL